MSTGQPQEHQDLRWPYAQPDDVWPQDGEQSQPVEHPADPSPHPAPDLAPGRSGGASQPARQAWDGGAASHEDGWKSDPGDLPGPDDDEDYEWIRYLGGGRSAQAKPAAAPARRPARSARGGRGGRGGRGKAERGGLSSGAPDPRERAPRSQRPAQSPPGVDPGFGAPEYTDPGDGQPGTGQPRIGQPVAGQPGDGRLVAWPPPGSAAPDGGRGPQRGNGRAGQADPATKRAPDSRGARADSRGDGADGRSGSAVYPPEAAPEPKRREQHRTPAPSRPPRRELKAREQDQREQKQVQQKLLEQERRDRQAREQQAREQDQRERQQRQRDAREQQAREEAERKQEAREQKAREQAQRKQKQKRNQPPRGATAKEPVQSAQRGRPSRRSRRGLSRRILWLTAGALLVVVAAAAVLVESGARSGGGRAHVLVTPPRLGIYVRNRALAGAMDAEALRAGIVRRSDGEAKNVVDAVYEDSTGPAAKDSPQIVLFIGGNLAGASASAFITSFTGKLSGAVTTSPGSLGGEAACVPSVQGRLAECAWADNDTFGVIASPTLGEAALAGELRQMRPLLEHAAR